MKTYNKLKRRDRDKLNSILLFKLHYNITINCLFLAIFILFIPLSICLLIGTLYYVFVALLFYGFMIVLYALMRILSNDCRENTQKYFGVRTIEKDIFKDGER